MKQFIQWGLIAAVVAIAAFLLIGQNAKNVASISVNQAHEMVAKDSTVLVLDVRTLAEFTGDLGHVENSVLIPIQELEQRTGELEKYKGRKILAICRTGRRSGIAVEELLKNGYNAVNVEGGMVQWNKAGFPVTK